MIKKSNSSKGEENIDKGVIIGKDGGAPWTSPSHPNAFRISSTESDKIAVCFKRKEFKECFASGVVIEGVKYQFLKENDGEIVYAQMIGQGSVTLQSSKTAIVIAHCPDGREQDMANKAVDFIVTYLKSLGI